MLIVILQISVEFARLQATLRVCFRSLERLALQHIAERIRRARVCGVGCKLLLPLREIRRIVGACVLFLAGELLRSVRGVGSIRRARILLRACKLLLLEHVLKRIPRTRVIDVRLKLLPETLLNKRLQSSRQGRVILPGQFLLPVVARAAGERAVRSLIRVERLALFGEHRRVCGLQCGSVRSRGRRCGDVGRLPARRISDVRGLPHRGRGGSGNIGDRRSSVRRDISGLKLCGRLLRSGNTWRKRICVLRLIRQRVDVLHLLRLRCLRRL